MDVAYKDNRPTPMTIAAILPRVFCKPVVGLKDPFEVIVRRRRNPDCCGTAFVSIAEQGSELCLVDQTEVDHLFCLAFGAGQNLGSSVVQVVILTDALSDRVKYGGWRDIVFQPDPVFIDSLHDWHHVILHRKVMDVKERHRA